MKGGGSPTGRRAGALLVLVTLVIGGCSPAAVPAPTTESSPPTDSAPTTTSPTTDSTTPPVVSVTTTVPPTTTVIEPPPSTTLPVEPLELATPTAIEIPGNWTVITGSKEAVPPAVHAHLGERFIGIESAYTLGDGGGFIEDDPELRSWVWSSDDGLAWERREAPDLANSWVGRVLQAGSVAFAAVVSVACEDKRSDSDTYQVCDGTGTRLLGTRDGTEWTEPGLPFDRAILDCDPVSGIAQACIVALGDTLVATVDGAWFVSSDGGTSFEPQQDPGPLNPGSIAVHRDLVTVVTADVVWFGKVDDATLTWTSYRPQTTGATRLGTPLAVRSLGDRLALMTRRDDGGGALWLSSAGIGWQRVDYPIHDSRTYVDLAVGSGWLVSARTGFLDPAFGTGWETGDEDRVVASLDGVDWFEVGRPPWRIPDDKVACEGCIGYQATATWMSVVHNTVFLARGSLTEREMAVESSLVAPKEEP